MDHPLTQADALVRPWRTAALLAGAVAALELLLLVVLGGALLAKPERAAKPPAAKAARTKAAAPAAAPKTTGKTRRPAAPAAAAQPRLARGKVSVLVLNGNGVTGAAAATAGRVQRRGYRIGGVANAPRTDYTRTVVMYRAGFAGEAQRLARDLDIPLVGPLDGLRPRDLHGAHAVVVVGA